jgi:chromosome segregation ATPase
VKSSLEERVAKIEGILEQVDKRLNHMESEIRDLKDRHERFEKRLEQQILLASRNPDINVGDNNTSNNIQIKHSKALI